MTPVVLVHGGGFDSRCWELLVPLLAPPVIAVDLPGRGRRPAAPESVTFADCARAIVEDIDAAGLEEVVLVGHSQAGCSLPRAMGLLGERVRHAVFVAALVPEDGRSPMGELAPHVSGMIDDHVERRRDTMDPAMAKAVFGNDLDDEQFGMVRCAPGTGASGFAERTGRAVGAARTDPSYLGAHHPRRHPPTGHAAPFRRTCREVPGDRPRRRPHVHDQPAGGLGGDPGGVCRLTFGAGSTFPQLLPAPVGKIFAVARTSVSFRMPIREFFHLIHVVDDIASANERFGVLFGEARFNENWSDLDRRWASFMMLGDTMVELIQPSEAAEDRDQALTKFRRRFGQHLHSLSWYVDAPDMPALFEAFLAEGVRVVKPGGGPFPEGTKDPGQTIFTHPKDTAGQMEFVGVQGGHLHFDPRSNEAWASTPPDASPLTLVGMSHFTMGISPAELKVLYERVLSAQTLREEGSSVFLRVGSESVVELAAPESAEPRARRGGER